MRNQMNLVLKRAGARENLSARFCVEQTDREPGASVKGSLGFLSGSHCRHIQPTMMVAQGWGLGVPCCVPEAGCSWRLMILLFVRRLALFPFMDVRMLASIALLR